VSGGYFKQDGLSISDMLRYTSEHGGSLEGYSHAEHITNEQLMRLEVDMLIPAALGGVIDVEMAHAIRAPIVLEAANSPTWPDADLILEQRGVVVLPDVLANAGGVTVSYFEWAQNRQHYQWTLNRVRQELDRVLADAFERVWELSNERKVSLRTAAWILGIGRVGRATVLGGIA
jgi:glutamate dehydrogenase (NAD(P)+)